jgi:hypothetical protein
MDMYIYIKHPYGMKTNMDFSTLGRRGGGEEELF